MNDTDLFSKHLAECGFSGFCHPDNEAPRLVVDIQRHSVNTLCVLRGLLQELLLFLCVRQEVQSFPIQDSVFLSLPWVAYVQRGIHSKLGMLVDV